MALSEQIQKGVQKLPTSGQIEVLDFVQYLVSKAEREAVVCEDVDWMRLSLSAAMRDMDDEETPDYTLADLKDTFS